MGRRQYRLRDFWSSHNAHHWKAHNCNCTSLRGIKYSTADDTRKAHHLCMWLFPMFLASNVQSQKRGDYASFRKLDKTGDGVITIEDLREVQCKTPSEVPEWWNGRRSKCSGNFWITLTHPMTKMEWWVKELNLVEFISVIINGKWAPKP